MTGRIALGTLIGPYARQVTKTKLKFWFVFTYDDDNMRRYEFSIDTHDRRPATRHRHIYVDEVVPTHASNFDDFMPPDNDDLARLPATPFPRVRKDKLIDACLSLLTDADVVDYTRVRMAGVLPLNTYTEWRPRDDSPRLCPAP